MFSPLSIFLENWVVPNRSTSLEHQLQNKSFWATTTTLLQPNLFSLLGPLPPTRERDYCIGSNFWKFLPYEREPLSH